MRNLFCVLAVMAVFGMNAQEVAESDTVANVKDVNNVVITEVNGGVNVTLKGVGDDKEYVYSYKHEVKPNSRVAVSQDWELNLPFKKSSFRKNKKRSKWAVVSGGIYMGFNSAVGDNPDLGVKMGSSVELAWDRILGVQYHPYAKGPYFSLGFGLGWKNYRISDSFKCFAGDKEFVELGIYPEGVYPKYSRLKVFSLRVPFSIRQKLGDDFSLSVSAIMNFNTHASVKNCYMLENETKVEESFNGAPVRKVSCDIMGALNYDCIGIYVKYTPQSIFKAGKGPEFKALTVGFGFCI